MISYKQIPFRNQQHPNAKFDLIRLEQFFQRQDLDHRPDQTHLVEFYILLFIEEGQGQHTIDFTDYDCRKGSLLSIRKDQLHKFVHSDSLKGALLLFTDEFLISYLEKQEFQKSLQLFNELLGVPKIQLSESAFEEIAAIVQRIENEYFNIRDDHSLNIIRSELHILITKLYRIKSQQRKMVVERRYLSEFIHLQSLVEQKVTTTRSVKEYAQMMGCSTKTLNNITKSIINKTAKAFIGEICIKQIKRLLINTSLSVKEIAYTSGFEEVPNFYKYFKHHSQTTPEQFRAAFR
ncbi:MAG: helix-turn-helix transcriptional regulator [Bacteroidota bacterium]